MNLMVGSFHRYLTELMLVPLLHVSSMFVPKSREGDIQFFKAFSTDQELPNRLNNPISSLPDLRCIDDEWERLVRIVSRSSSGLEADEDSPSIS